jgi:hypothetical protein
VARGIGHAVGAFTGLEIVPGGDLLALVAFTVAAAATGWAVLKIPRPPALAAGALLGIPAMYAIIGLVRAQLASDFATRSRYVYVAAFLIVIAFADWLPWLRDRVRGRRGHLALRGALAVILVVIIASNVIQLMAIQARFEANSDLTRAYVELAVEHQGEPWVDPASVLLGMPPLPALLAILERSGSPTRDDLFPALARDPGAPARETALLRMTGAGFHATPAIGRGSPVAFEVTASRGVTVATDDGCLSLHGSGRDASVTVVVPTGTRVRLTATDGVAGRAVLGFELPPSRAIELAAPAATPVDLVLPDLGDGSSWIVRLEFRAASGTIQACPIAVD